MIASLTRHLVSSASSTIAGNRLWDNWAIPITWRRRKTLYALFIYILLSSSYYLGELFHPLG